MARIEINIAGVTDDQARNAIAFLEWNHARSKPMQINGNSVVESPNFDAMDCQSLALGILRKYFQFVLEGANTTKQ